MPRVRILSDSDVRSILDLGELVPTVEAAFIRQHRGEVERPDRPHFPVGIEPEAGADEAAGTGLVMPAYIHGEDTYATKLVGVHEGNTERGLPTVNAQLVLTDAGTGQPLAFMHANRITNARTGCIGGLAARELANEPVKLGVIGAGQQARWQTRAIATTTDVEHVRIYSPSDSKTECAADLRNEFDIDATAVDSPREAVKDATVVVTATTATEPVFPGDALAPGTLVVAIGAYTSEMQELDSTVFDQAASVFADVPEEVAEIGDIKATGVDPGRLEAFGACLAGENGRENENDIVVVESVGTAVLDAAAGAHVYERAVERDAGTSAPF